MTETFASPAKPVERIRKVPFIGPIGSSMLAVAAETLEESQVL